MFLEYAVLVLVFGAILAVFVYTLMTGVPPVPTTPAVRSAMLALIPEDFRGTIFELGAGWGGLAFALAGRYPHCPVVAFELSPLPWAVMRLRQALVPRPNLEIRRADYRKASLAPAALVVCYLFPAGMARLKDKFGTELAPGTMVVSNTFAVPGWRAATVRRARDLYGSQVYLYVVPHCWIGEAVGDPA